MTFHVNCAQRAGRAKILAGSAAYATFGVHGRDKFAAFLKRDHTYSSDRTVAGTVAAIDTIPHHHAVLGDGHSVSYLD